MRRILGVGKLLVVSWILCVLRIAPILAVEYDKEATATSVEDFFKYSFKEYGGRLEGGASFWEPLGDSRPYFEIAPNGAFEGKRIALGGALGFSRVDLVGDAVDRARLEVDFSVQFHRAEQWKSRLIFYGTATDVNADELRSSPFDPSGTVSSYGAQMRWRKQEHPNPQVDGIFVRPESYLDGLVGLQHLRRDVNGVESFSDGWTFHGDVRLPIEEGCLPTKEECWGAFRASFSVTRSEFQRSALNPGHTDTQTHGRLTYSYPAHVKKDGRLDFLFHLDYTDYRSDVPEFDGRDTAAVVAIRWSTHFLLRNNELTPDNEDSSTTSPADLGPPRPRPGP